MGQQEAVWARTAKDRESWRLWQRATSGNGSTQPRIEKPGQDYIYN